MKPFRSFNLAKLAPVIVLLSICSCATAFWPSPEAVTRPSTAKTLCLKRHLSWKAVGYTSDILDAGFDRYALADGGGARPRFHRLALAQRTHSLCARCCCADMPAS